MRRHTLYFKFILAYLVLVVAGFILTATLGSYLVESRLKNSIADDLYRLEEGLVPKPGEDRDWDWKYRRK